MRFADTLDTLEACRCLLQNLFNSESVIVFHCPHSLIMSGHAVLAVYIQSPNFQIVRECDEVTRSYVELPESFHQNRLVMMGNIVRSLLSTAHCGFVRSLLSTAHCG